MSRVAFSWNGLPQYAARLLRGALDALGEDCVVVGSPPSVPVVGMEQALGQRIHWLDADRPAHWSDLGMDVPKIYVQSGWAYQAFTALGREVKATGGKVIGMSDANWRGDFRQIVLGPLAFRYQHRPQVDAMLVPGRQGLRLMRWFGMPADRVRMGMYGADPALFRAGPALAGREKRFLYVGQFTDRKDVLGLANAFVRFADRNPDWTLHLVGSGEQRALIPNHPRIEIEDFVQPEQLGARYARARFFVLPSLSEAWGLVVHEAALSGCALILSDAIGSADDLRTPLNGVRFRAGSPAGLERALEAAAAFDDKQLELAEAKSLELAKQFGPKRFGREVKYFVDSFSGA